MQEIENKISFHHVGPRRVVLTELCLVLHEELGNHMSVLRSAATSRFTYIYLSLFSDHFSKNELQPYIYILLI